VLLRKKLLFTVMNKPTEYKLYLFNLNWIVSLYCTKHFLLNIHEKTKIDIINIYFIISKLLQLIIRLLLMLIKYKIVVAYKQLLN